MDIRQFFQGCFLVIFLINIHLGLSITIDEDYEDGPSFGRCPWIRNKLKNGRVRYRYKGRVAKFLCDSGFELAGKRSSTCVRGQWSNPLPVCVARGCNRVPTIPNGRVTEMYRGALLVYDCNPGYTLDGVTSIHCDGRRWSTGAPECVVATDNPEVSCDFENPDLCGWSHDPNHDFDWKRNQFATPSGHAGTGPSFDHTFGENKGGYYLYIEASSPRKINDTARLFSPVYSASLSGGCFQFWYHMYGATTGGIRVYLKPESHVFDELTPTWEKYGDQGNQWLRGNIVIPGLHENFQIVIEGLRGESYVGDSAIDDVLLTTLDCESMENDTGIAEKTMADSCRGRCREADTGSPCGCSENCNTAQNCCSDYALLCVEGNDTAVQSTDEPLPGFYDKTTSPVTQTTIHNIVKQSSTTPSIGTSKSSEQTTTVSTSATKTSLPQSIASSSSIPVISSTISSTTLSSTPSTKSTFFVSRTAPQISTIPSTSVEPTEATISSTTTAKPSLILTSSAKTISSSTTPKINTVTSSTPIRTTISSTTSVATTATSTSTQAITTSRSTQTTSPTTVLTTISTTENPPYIRTTAVPQSETTGNALFTSTVVVPSISTQTTPTSPSAAVTIISSTRKTYNLRPRTQRTTPATSTTSTENVTPIVTNSTDISNSNTVSSNTLFKEDVTAFSEVTNSSTYSTSWHNFPVSQNNSSTRSSEQSTTIPTIKTTPRTSTSRRYTIQTRPPPFRTPPHFVTLGLTTKRTRTTIRTPPQIYTSRLTTSSEPPSPATANSYEMGTSKTESSASSGSVPIVVSFIVIAIICVAGGVAFYMRKQRNKRQSKLSDDSEMRFLQESEYMEYSDASALDKILAK